MVHLVLDAVKEGCFEALEASLLCGDDVNARDQDGWTALTLAAADGRVDLLQLLLEFNAGINYPNQWGETALSRAVFGGHIRATQLLLDKEAYINLPDEDGDTPVHVAVISGHLNVLCLLLERNANVEVKNKTGVTALEMAHKYGRSEMETMLEDYRKVSGKIWKAAQHLGGWLSYMVGRPGGTEPEEEAAMDKDDDVVSRLGSHYSDREDESLKGSRGALSDQNTLSISSRSSGGEGEANVTSLLPILLELCAGMAETQDVCEDLLERLQRVQMLMDEKGNALSDQVRVPFQRITIRFHAFLTQHTNQTSVERLASTRTILGLLRDFHYDLDEVIGQIAPAESVSILTNWEARWDIAVAAVEDRLVTSWEENSSALCRELPDTTSQTAALLLLNSENTRHKPRYSARSQNLLETASKKIARMSGAPIPKIPEWFVPRHEVQRQARPFASGSYGQVYRGIWRGSKVVTKCVTVTTPSERKAFLREAKIWHKARHPHIVNFFGACYDTHPCFFICEEASNGNLVDYFDKMKAANRALIWSKLHEAALGLEYLHQNDIVHGDLKCNQILVTGEGVAKLTDFGFSFVLSGSKPTGSGGATRWRAPECLGCSGQMPTFESDVYSFGMCVVEAVTHDVPWGVYLPDIAVMDHLRHRQFLPRPKQFVNDAEWEFVLALCAFEPSRRIRLSDAIKQLERFAQGGGIPHKVVTAAPSILGGQHSHRLSKKVSLSLLEEARTAQATSKVFYTVLALTARSRYLRFRRAVQTIQLVFRFKIFLRQNKAMELRTTALEKVSGFIRMAYQRNKFLRFIYAVKLLQCRFRYLRIRRVNAEDVGHKAETKAAKSLRFTSNSGIGTNVTTPPTPLQTTVSRTQHSTDEPSTQTFRSPWVSDEDRIKCCICLKDFTMFRRKHHCRVCFEIICSHCSLTRRKMRVCMACAGLRPPTDPLLTVTTRPQARRRGRILDSTGRFLNGLGSLLSRRGTSEMAAYSLEECATGAQPTKTTDSHNVSSHGQVGLWEDDAITAARIPRSSVTIVKKISRGAFGMVHLGTWNEMQVAIKTLLPDDRKSIHEINQFLAEAKMIAAMEHPCIVNLLGVAWDTLADVCMVMEYMDGGDLRSLLYEYDETQHPVGFDAQKLSIALNVADALTYLHSLTPAVLHRDLKSPNILLNRELKAKVTDFGVSREVEDRTMTAGVGTYLWMAPEVIMGERYNEKSDIFSFGIVLCEMDTHKLPYSEERVSKPDVVVMQLVVLGRLKAKFSQDTPQSIVELGNACLSLEPAARPSAAEVMYRLHSMLRCSFSEVTARCRE